MECVVRRRYPTDLSDTKWRTVAALLPPAAHRGRPRTTNLRDVVNGLHYRWTTGCAWRMLPHDFPPWATVYNYVRRWNRDGTLRRLRTTLLRSERPTARDAAEWPSGHASDNPRP